MCAMWVGFLLFLQEEEKNKINSPNLHWTNKELRTNQSVYFIISIVKCQWQVSFGYILFAQYPFDHLRFFCCPSLNECHWYWDTTLFVPGECPCRAHTVRHKPSSRFHYPSINVKISFNFITIYETLADIGFMPCYRLALLLIHNLYFVHRLLLFVRYSC